MSLSNKQQGVALLEVMISVLILAVGLLGLAQLQILTLKYNESAYLRTQASTLASGIFDSMRANHAAAQFGKYKFGPLIPAIAVADQDSMAEDDLAKWRNNISAMLPSGTGTVNCADSDPLGDALACSEGSIYNIKISWNEVKDDGARGKTEFEYFGAL